MSDTEIQITLEKIHNKNQLMPRLREVFGHEFIVDHMRENGIPITFGVDLLCQIGLHKRATFKTLMGLLYRHFGEEVEDLQRCADMLTLSVLVGLCGYDPVAGEFIVKIEIPDDVQADLDRYQYPLPMVIPPKKLKNNKSNAYYTGGGSVILKSHNHHDDDVCIEHLDRSNRVALCLNVDTARMIENQWKDLDRQKDDETKEEFKKRQEAFRKYDRDARDVMDLIFMAGNRFHMTHRYDKRGRTYAQGHHINPQGNSWNKAVIEFADGEVVSD